MEENRRDDELFAALQKAKKRKRVRRVVTVLVIVGIIAGILAGVVAHFRAKVDAAVASDNEDFLSYTVACGSISTRVTGSGPISNVDTESITVPDGVAVDEVLAKANTRLEKGDIIATLDMPTVLTAMASVQKQIEELDGKIAEAGSDKVNAAVKAGVKGRIKKIFIAKNMDVATCVYENGALALISLDGHMAADIPAGDLNSGDSVSVRRPEGKPIKGTVERVVNGTATVLVTDNGPLMGEEVTVCGADGTELGTGTLYIHNAFSITGFAGTVASVNVKENQNVTAATTICTLKDTAYSAAYDGLLKQRRELENTLIELMTLRQNGALRASFTGTVLSVDYDEGGADTSAAAAAPSMSGMDMFSYFTGGMSSAAASAAPAAADDDTEGTKVVTMSRDERMEAVISVDESDILALEVGQQAMVTIESIGERVYPGTVTEIDRTAASTSGVTAYSATVTFDKTEGMLAGMTADVTVNITGSENVLIVPVDAVHRTRAAAYVYMSYNKETDTFGDEKEVVTGISNDEYIEIVSGLAEGDVIWYREAAVNPFMMMGFGGGNYGGRGGYGGGRR